MKTLRLLLPLLAVMMLAGCMGCGSEERMAAAGKLDAKCPIKVGDSLSLVEAHFSPTYAMVFDFEGTTNLPEEPSMAQTRAFVQAIRTVPEIDSLLAFVRQNPSGLHFNINDGMVDEADTTLVAESDTMKAEKRAVYMSLTREQFEKIYP